MATNNDNIATFFLRAGMAAGSENEADFEWNGKPARLYVALDGTARCHHVLKKGESSKPVATGKVAPSGLTGEKMPRAILTLRPVAKGGHPQAYAMWKHVREDDAFWTIQPRAVPAREGTLLDF